MEVEVRGANELETLSRRLKAVGDGELRKELLKGIREASKPTIKAIKTNAGTVLPKSGGLAGKVQRSRIGSRTRATGKNAGVRIEAKNAFDVASLDRGRLRHPVFGNREVWVQQSVDPGWFSEPIEKDLPEIQKAVLKVMDDVAKKAANL